MEIILANTILGLSRYLRENHFDLIVVHGDRVEALAGATVGALRNILVAHIEGGELSGTIDELIRHSISKLSHIHFVATEKAKTRLEQLGESKESIFNIGSPDVDVMLSDSLPTLHEAKSRYEISFEEYSLAILHPVTTKYELQKQNADIFVESLLKSNRNYILIYPNNDLGSEYIFDAYRVIEGRENVKIFPSIRFEYFLTLLKYSRFLIGNSSAGIHEAPVYGVPSINIGTRQENRLEYESILNVPFNTDLILDKIQEALGTKPFKPCNVYGVGNSAGQFLEKLKTDIWAISNQKQFKDI